VGKIKVGVARLDERVKGVEAAIRELRSDAKWVIALVIASILVPILLKLIFK
jgi:hypothetical protein